MFPYATHNQSYPSTSEERAARWVGFGEHVGDALTHKLLDDDVGSPQVSFLMCTLEIPQKLQYKFFCS